MSNLLEKEAKFIFDDACLLAFNTLKERLISAPIIVVPEWSQSFEIMCDASDYALGAVLGQRRDNMCNTQTLDNIHTSISLPRSGCYLICMLLYPVKHAFLHHD